MYKLIALYRSPPNPEHFRDYYVNKHLPLVEKMPGIVRMNHTFDVKDLQGGTPYFCIFECYFRNAGDMIASASSPEGQAVTADIANYEPGEFEIIHFEIPDEQ
jgi:uncharacterized protein (TIGR02118 family)